jgi:hypothetical protein
MDCNIMILCSHKNDVDKYNDVLIHKFFQPHEIFIITLELMLHLLKMLKIDSKFNRLKYVVIATKVMIIENTNICKGAINGTIVIVTSFLFYDNEIITSIIISY